MTEMLPAPRKVLRPFSKSAKVTVSLMLVRAGLQLNCTFLLKTVFSQNKVQTVVNQRLFVSRLAELTVFSCFQTVLYTHTPRLSTHFPDLGTKSDENGHFCCFAVKSV